MQPHLLVSQLRFARREFARGLEGVSEADGIRRLLPMNSISWMVGHLSNQEHRYWVMRVAISLTHRPGIPPRRPEPRGEGSTGGA